MSSPMSMLQLLIPGVPAIVQYIILVALSAAACAVVISLLFRWIRTFGIYAYANARVGARKADLFRRERLTRLLESRDITDVMGVLQESRYSPHLIEIGVMSPPSFEMAFQAHRAKTYSEVADMVPEEMRGVFDEMLKIVDVRNLKTLLVCKQAGLSAEKTMEMILPGGTISRESLEHFFDAASVPELVGRLEGTEYWPAVHETLGEFEEKKNLLPLQHALDRHYYGTLWKKIRAARVKYIEVVKSLVGMKIDAQNIKTVLRCKADELPPEEILRYVLPFYQELSEERVRRMAEAKDVAEAIMMLEGTDYGGVLSDVLSEYVDTKSLYFFEKTLDDFILKRARSIAVQYSVGVGPTIAFLLEKDIEVRNLTVVVNGESAGLKPEEIEKHVIRG